MVIKPHGVLVHVEERVDTMPRQHVHNSLLLLQVSGVELALAGLVSGPHPPNPV